MREPSEGNRILVGKSGIPFEVPVDVATGLVNSHKADYADGRAAPPKGRGAHVLRKPQRQEADDSHDGEGAKRVDLEKLTVKELKELADEHDIDLGDASKKADIIEILYNELARGDE